MYPTRVSNAEGENNAIQPGVSRGLTQVLYVSCSLSRTRLNLWYLALAEANLTLK
ncbi:hypothetical protein CERZMDRAFT_90868 [Cercospora zeae-maydis SCOH1-5]|uniref:Uncharacterized protein n=1 Tax=Cercospora zeae-maydis SCOH1-5 TaxID=717836 RepID=A0A6A6FE15_9PEZI|nr:hypothetical protein CERZMDRAFT_90868 [Cercospora zeae-maydis SCOH1-5]